MRKSNRTVLLAIYLLAMLSFLMRGAVFGEAQTWLGHPIEVSGLFLRYATFSNLFIGVQLVGLLASGLLGAMLYRSCYKEKVTVLFLSISFGIQLVVFVLGITKLALG